jgi:hypothetical protein
MELLAVVTNILIVPISCDFVNMTQHWSALSLLQRTAVAEHSRYRNAALTQQFPTSQRITDF